jgi:predicted ATPase
MLFQQGVPPQAFYTFKHALIQDAAYQSLLKSTRQQYHEKIAHVLENHFKETAAKHPELLAHHYTEAGLKDQAIVHWHKAGQMATQRSANLEAIAHLTKGLDLVQTLVDSPERSRQELELRVALGVPMTATKGFAAPEVEQVYAPARELCQHLGETPRLFPVLRGLWLFYMVRADLGAAQELGQQLLRLARSAEDSALLLEAHVALGLTLFYLGELTQSREQLERGITIYDPEKHHHLAYTYGDDPGVVCLSYGSIVLWLLGYPEQAIARDREVLALAEKLSHPFSLAFALNFSARLHQCLRAGQAAQQRAEASIALSIEQGFAHWVTTGKMLQGWAMAEQGNREDAIITIREGFSSWQATGAEVAGPHYLALLAETYRCAGQPEDALDVIAEGLSAVERNGERLYEAELYRLRGELLLDRPDANPAEAEACSRQALEVARRQNARSLELRAGMSLSRLLNRKGRGQEARRILEEIYDWFTEGMDTADLTEAKALLHELS